jgi:hypothetical protein
VRWCVSVSVSTRERNQFPSVLLQPTRTSLPFEINDLRAVRNRLSHTSPIPTSFLDLLCGQPFAPGMQRAQSNLCRPPNVPRRRTAFSLSCARVSRRTQGDARKLGLPSRLPSERRSCAERCPSWRTTPCHHTVIACKEQVSRRHVRPSSSPAALTASVMPLR